MTMDQWVSVFSALVAFAGLLAVAVQMRENTRQSRLGNISRIYDINRELLSMGFDQPVLFQILNGASGVDPLWEKHYLQMWFNQLSLVHLCLKRGGFDAEFQESLERDIGYFMMLESMRRHWDRFSIFYPDSFKDLVNGIIAKQASPVES